MKKLFYVTFACMALTLSGCGVQDEVRMELGKEQLKTDQRNRISENQATQLAEQFRNASFKTRSKAFSHVSTEYVTTEKSTRSSNSVDTVAYVFNYPEDGGFIIVSSDRRVYPILAFSESGNFTFENETAKECFIDNLDAYINNSESEKLYDLGDGGMDACNFVNPIVATSIHQGSPWSDYVEIEHPGCPVGCVAVAVANVMSYSKERLVYHNSNFYLKTIVTKIEEGLKRNKNNGISGVECESNEMVFDTIPHNLYDYPAFPPTTFSQAIDHMAKLLYYIGLDVNMNYTPTGSGAYSYDAYNLVKSLNFEVSSFYWNFNGVNVANYLIEDYICYVSGSGHAWVIDGCNYCVSMEDSSQIIDIYFHCDWGWGGSCNGYFSGNVFETEKGGKYRPSDYFAVKREWKD